MSPSHRRRSRPALLLAAAAVVGTATWANDGAWADEAGIGFWLPGQYGSLAALPQQPGWSMAAVYYHANMSGGGAIQTSHEIRAGRFNPTVDLSLSGNLSARADMMIFAPNYVFASPVLGGQLSVGVTAIAGRASPALDAVVSATVGPATVTRTFSAADSITGVGDLYPKASLRWNHGVHNYMVYGTAGIPIGAYDSARMANIGTGHWAIDGGAGYTYFNPQTGHEFSAVSGLTYNFTNPATGYRNGVDWHIDWGASQFLSKQVHVGLVGYLYKQLTADSGAPAILGDFKSEVLGVGPQIGYMFPLGSMQGYVNLKAYKEFENQNRAAGWNAWVTFAVSPAATPPASVRASLKR